MTSTSTAVSTPPSTAIHGIPPGPPPVPFHGADLAGPDRLVGQEPPQVLGHRLGRLVPRLGVLLDRLQDDRLQVARDPGVERPGPRRLLGLDLLDQLEPVRRVEGRRRVSSS